jgi:TonB family protein
MIKGWIAFLMVFSLVKSGAQTNEKYPELEGKPVGGKDEVEQVIQTQLSLTKPILTSNFDEEITCFFDLDSTGSATNIKFSKGLNNVLRAELTRIFKLIRFEKTQAAAWGHNLYWYSFKLSTDKYNKFYKQKTKFKPKAMPADSSYVIYTRSDRSPEYFKNGEEGLNEFILAEIEYPKIAKEKSIEGTVMIEFVVETNGYVTGMKVKQNVNGGCSEEALRIIKQTRWQPAQLNGKYIRYRNTYPITFSLRNVNKDGTQSGQ